MPRPKALLSWSSGKDSAWALHLLRSRGEVDVVGLLTSVNESSGRIAVHGVRDELLGAQASAVGLPVMRVPIPNPCPNTVYDRVMGEAMDQAKAQGITAVAFGDLFLEDVRRYREERLAAAGMEPLFPLWGRDTAALAKEMVQGGLRAILTAVDIAKLDRSFAGATFDGALLDRLPAGVDPCGERGEFHTFACAGPCFAAAVPVRVAGTFEGDGLVHADIVLAPPVP